MKRPLSILLAILPFFFAQVVFAEPFTMVSPKVKARIVIAKGEPGFIDLAAADLAGDVREITGVELPVLKGKKPRKGDVYICTRPDPARWESYDVVVSGGILTVSGSDERGTMFGIYDFIERYLGVDPLSYWNDTPYPTAGRLEWEDVHIVQGPPDFRFRGWFINDEDLLTAWKEPSGQRRIDYPYYSTVVNHDIMERIAETLVRCRCNLIIPASFLNIANPPEAALADICAKRGVFLSMHHIEPLGVSGFTYQNYWKDRGEDASFSYFSHPGKMVEVWRETARLWAKYPRVVWQVGLRGIADRPMWTADPNVPKTDEGRGKLISEAIARQIGILDEIGVPEKDRYVSTTLWMEGASLNRQGFLAFPKGVIVVFADNGPGWKWTPDFQSVERNPDNRYGVYYHHALIGDGPHLAPLTPVTVTYRMMQEAVSRQSSEYAIFNVSNIREFTYNIDATSKMLWDMEAFSPEGWTREWIGRHYAADREEWMRAYTMYYNALQLHPVANIPLFLDGYLNGICRNELAALEKEIGGERNPKSLREPFRETFPGTPEGDRDRTRKPSLGSKAQQYAALCAQKASFELAMELSSALYARLPEEEKPFALTTIVHPSALMYHFTAFAADLIHVRELLAAGNGVAARKSMQEALSEMDAIRKADVPYCSGKWENWYRDCRKVDIGALDRKVRALSEKLSR
jgi:hypothetical protein